MIDKKKLSEVINYEKQKIYTAKADSITEISFYMDKNYYRITNTGTTPVYVATTYTPTTTKYDCKVDGGTVGNFNEPSERNTLYILNTSKEDITILITSFLAEFDPSFSALGEVSMEIKGTVATDGIVKGFECSLPEGDNTIGSVELGQKSYYRLTEIHNTNARMEEKLNNMNENGTKKSQLDDVLTKLEEIESIADNQNTINSSIHAVKTAIENMNLVANIEKADVNIEEFKQVKKAETLSDRADFPYYAKFLKLKVTGSENITITLYYSCDDEFGGGSETIPFPLLDGEYQYITFENIILNTVKRVATNPVVTTCLIDGSNFTISYVEAY